MWGVEMVRESSQGPGASGRGFWLLTCVAWCAHSSLGLTVFLVDGVAKIAQLYERVAPLLGAVQQRVLQLDVPAAPHGGLSGVRTLSLAGLCSRVLSIPTPLQCIQLH